MVSSQKQKLTGKCNTKSKGKITAEKNWYVFYTSPNAEKRAEKELADQGYEAFLPVNKTLRTWKNGQKKLVHQVLFPNYIFVNTKATYLHSICQLSKILTFIHCSGKPSVISIESIEGIKKMLKLEQEVIVNNNFSEGEKVRITRGPLLGYEGVLVKQKNKTRFGIQLLEINQTVFIDICTSLIEKIVCQ